MVKVRLRRLLGQLAALVVGNRGDAEPDRRAQQPEDPLAAFRGKRGQFDSAAEDKTDRS
jgi:hypothetical protein